MIHDTKQGYYLLLMHNVCYDFVREGMNIYVKDPSEVDFNTIPSGSPSVFS